MTRPSALLTLALTACMSPPRPAPTPSVAPGAFVAREIDAGPLGTRRYTLYAPGARRPNERLPLVVMLHGCTQDPADFARGARVAAHAERARVLVLLPEQPEGANPKKCWNWYDPAHQRRGAGEPALVAAMTEQVIGAHAADPARVYVAGISAGGAMALTIALAYPELYAALGVHSGVAYGAARDVVSALGVMQRGAAAPPAGAGDAAAAARGAERSGAPGAPLPAIVFHGAADRVVAPANGEQVVAQLLAGRGETRDVARGERNGYRFERVLHGGPAAPLVEAWTVEGLGHAWSGGSPEGTFTDERGPDATGEMLRFFREHPRRAAAPNEAGAPR